MKISLIFFLWLPIVANVDGGKVLCRNLEISDCIKNGCEIDEGKGCVERILTVCDKRKAQPIPGDKDGLTCADTDHDDNPCYYFSDFKVFMISPVIEVEKNVGEEGVKMEREIEREKKEKEGYTQCVSKCPVNYIPIAYISSPTRYFCEKQICSKRVPYNDTCSLPGGEEYWTSHCIIQADGTSCRSVSTSFHGVDCSDISADVLKAWPCGIGCFYDIYRNNCSAVCDGCVRHGRCVPNTVNDADECSRIVANFGNAWPCGIASNCYYDDCVGRCVTCEGWGESKGSECHMMLTTDEELDGLWDHGWFHTTEIADYETCKSRTPDFSQDFKWPCGIGDCMYDPLVRECINVCDLRWNEYEAGDDGVCVPLRPLCELMMECYYDPYTKMCSKSCVEESFADRMLLFGQPRAADLYGCGGIEPSLNGTQPPCGAENGHCYYNGRLGKCVPCGDDGWQINKICEVVVMDQMRKLAAI